MKNVGLIDLGKAGGGNPSLWPHGAMHHSNTHKIGRRRRKRRTGAFLTPGCDEAHRTTKPERKSTKKYQ